MPDLETLKQVIRALEENNRARYAEIQDLRKQIKALKARLTRMQGNAERKNKGSSHAPWCATQTILRYGDLAERGPCNCNKEKA